MAASIQAVAENQFNPFGHQLFNRLKKSLGFPKQFSKLNYHFSVHIFEEIIAFKRVHVQRLYFTKIHTYIRYTKQVVKLLKMIIKKKNNFLSSDE